MVRALVIALREVRSYLQDKGDLAFSLLLPIVIFALMYGAFGGSTIFHGTAYVVNEDPGGSYAALLLERLGNLDDVDVVLLSSENAEDRLKRSDIQLVTYIPASFSANLSRGWPAELIFRQRGNGSQEGQIVASFIRGKAQEISQEVQLKRQVLNVIGGSQKHTDTTVQKFLDREREHPFVTVTEEYVGSRPDPVYLFLPGIITMFVLFAITMSSRTLVEERNNRTLERLLTTRPTTGELFGGKFLASTARGFIQTFILLVLDYAVFRLFTPVSFFRALTVALVFAAASSTVGLLIGSVSRTLEQANWIAVLITMSMTMLGGTFFTITRDSALYSLSRLSLNTYANDAFKVIIARDGSLSDVWQELAVIAAVTVTGLLLSRILFRVVPGGR
ncbi:MAG: ABC transporter permease [Chloroflexota bacterium]